MAKIRKIIWLIIIIILIGAFMLAFNVRNSFIKDTDINLYINDKDILYTLYEHEEDVTKDFIRNEKISTLKELEKTSSLIVRVKIDNSAPREIYEGATLTKANIKEVFKGKLDKDSIYLFEPFDVITYDPVKIYSLDGYNLMGKDSEYILFLKDMKDSNYTPDDTIYMPTTTLLSKFTINDKIVKSTGRNLKYNIVKNSDIITDNEKDIKKYNEMKNDVLNKYINK